MGNVLATCPVIATDTYCETITLHPGTSLIDEVSNASRCMGAFAQVIYFKPKRMNLNSVNLAHMPLFCVQNPCISQLVTSVALDMEEE